jgi:hypothetical protein
MSQGPGWIQQAILEAIGTNEADASNADGTGPVGVSREDLIVRLFGPKPLPTQRDSFNRAVRSLAEAHAYPVSRRVKRPVRYRQHKIGPCEGPDCNPCFYGVARTRDPNLLKDFRRLFRDDPVALKAGKTRGIHRWENKAEWFERQEVHYVNDAIIGRPRTREEFWADQERVYGDADS